MIPFSKSFLGITTIFSVHGSAFPRVVVPSILSTLICMAVTFSGFNYTLINYMPDWKSYQIFASITGFVLVFRTSLSYSRYWEGMTRMMVCII